MKPQHSGVFGDGARRIGRKPNLDELDTLAKVADVILAYRPKSKQPKPRKRKPSQRKSKGCICDPKCREDQIGRNPYCKAKHAGATRD